MTKTRRQRGEEKVRRRRSEENVENPFVLIASCGFWTIFRRFYSDFLGILRVLDNISLVLIAKGQIWTIFRWFYSPVHGRGQKNVGFIAVLGSELTGA